MSGATAAILQKDSICKASPLSVGSIPAFIKIASAADDDPYRLERADRSIFRRWAKAASIIVKTFARDSSLPAVSRLVNPTSFESTLGAGQKIDLETVPTFFTSAHHAALTLGIPYSLPPGFAAKRSATSACTITTPVRRVGNFSSRCRSTGTETLYGKLATRTVGTIGNSLTANASLLILNSSYRPFLKVRFYDIFPTFLSGIDFDSTLPDTDNIIASVNFAYSYFDIESI